MPKLGVNIDHIATLRQARLGLEPDVIEAAKICERAGADGIVAHLREDRRHIQDNDIYKLKQSLTKQFNLEMSLNKGIIQIALDVKPDVVTLVPERRQELTTEGGLDLLKFHKRVQRSCDLMHDKDILVSVFIAPLKRQIKLAKLIGADIIEIHTGLYDHALKSTARKKQLERIKLAAQYGQDLGLGISAGHGLKYHNTAPIAKIKGMQELNIGHSIICRAAMVGLSKAVREMKSILKG